MPGVVVAVLKAAGVVRGARMDRAGQERRMDSHMLIYGAYGAYLCITLIYVEKLICA